MSGPNFCWYCSKALVGPGGKPHREPLHFRVIKTQDGHEVRAHAGCVEEALHSVNTPTAQPSQKE